MAVEVAERTEVGEESPEARARRWQTDTVSFAEQDCVIRDPSGAVGPIRLFPHQREWLAQADARDELGNLVHHYAVACWGKRDGKSLDVSILGANRLFAFPESQSYVLSNSERQGGSIIMGRIREITERSPSLAAMGPQIDTSRNGVPMRISVPALGTTIEVLPCNVATVQGIAIGPWSLFLSDEVHAAQDPRAFQYLAAQTEAANSLIALSSQAGPPVESNPVYRLYQARNEPEIHFDYRSTPGTPWAQKQAALDKKVLPRPVYDLLWGNAWGSKGQRLFTPDQVDAARLGYKLPKSREQWEKLRTEWKIRRVGCGLDRALGWAREGGSGDNSVWTTVAENREGHCYVIQMELLPTGAEHEVLAAARKARDLFGARSCILEQYQCGDIAEKVQQILPRTQLLAMTTNRKVVMFNTLYEEIANEFFHYPAKLKTFRKELLSITVDTTNVQPRFEGKPHDDTVDSAVWARAACESGAMVMKRWRDKPKGM